MPAIYSFLVIFLAELGDKTQLGAFALTAKYGSPFLVWLGATLGMVAANLLGAAAEGEKLEWSTLYLDAENIARQEGFEDAAVQLFPKKMKARKPFYGCWWRNIWAAKRKSPPEF